MIKDISFLFKQKIDIVDGIIEYRESPISPNVANVLYGAGEVTYYRDILWKNLSKKIEPYHTEEIELKKDFWFNPYQLSIELYNTPVLGDMLLKLNGFLSVYEFKTSNVKVFSVSGVDFVTQELIMNASEIKKYKFNQTFNSETLVIKKI